MSEFYTVEEVARKLKVAVPTVYAWGRTGKLQVYKFEKCVRIHEDDLEAFIEERRQIRLA
jgi:excisionase family DNA binding protein